MSAVIAGDTPATQIENHPTRVKQTQTDATGMRPASDVKTMCASNLDYKIVILFFSSAPPQKLSSLITGKLNPFSLTP
jgi:hypothetical protein